MVLLYSHFFILILVIWWLWTIFMSSYHYKSIFMWVSVIFYSYSPVWQEDKIGKSLQYTYLLLWGIGKMEGKKSHWLKYKGWTFNDEKRATPKFKLEWAINCIEINPIEINFICIILAEFELFIFDRVTTFFFFFFSSL